MTTAAHLWLFLEIDSTTVNLIGSCLWAVPNNPQEKKKKTAFLHSWDEDCCFLCKLTVPAGGGVTEENGGEFRASAGSIVQHRSAAVAWFKRYTVLFFMEKNNSFDFAAGGKAHRRLDDSLLGSLGNCPGQSFPENIAVPLLSIFCSVTNK